MKPIDSAAGVPPALYAVLLAIGASLFLVADHALHGWPRVTGMGAGALLCLLLPLAPAAIAPSRPPLQPKSTAGSPSALPRW